jgi:hypothetical protein
MENQKLMTKYAADIAAVMQAGTAIIVTNEETFQIASQLMLDVKALEKNLDEERKEKLKPYEAKVKEINAYYQPQRKALVKIEGSKEPSLYEKLNRGVSDYQVIKKAKIDELNRIEAAKLKTEKDKIEAKAREDRLKAEELRKQAEAITSPIMRDKLLQRADNIDEKADIKIELSMQKVAPVYSAPKFGNQKLIWNYWGVIEDKRAFVEACLKNGCLGMLDVNQSALDAAIKPNGNKNKNENSFQFPGVVVKSMSKTIGR